MSAMRKKSSVGIGSRIGTVFRIAFFIVAVAGIVNSYIYLNQKIVETDRKIASGKRETHKVEREIELLRVQREKFRSWSHIRPMMARFGLKLVPPQSGQVHSLAVLSAEQAALVPFVCRSSVQEPAAEKLDVQKKAAPETAVAQVIPRKEPVRQKAVRKKTVKTPVKKVYSAPVKTGSGNGLPKEQRRTARTRNGFPLFDASAY